MDWYTVNNEDQLDSPSLLVYKDRVIHNIDLMIAQVTHIHQLIPHIKTNKMRDVIAILKDKGINQVKTATIAEAELAAQVGIEHILIAHQLVGPKQDRLIALIQRYDQQSFATIVDDKQVIRQLAQKATAARCTIDVYLDVNSGMNRSGFPIDQDIFSFYTDLYHTAQLNCKGLHIYDGQYRDPDFNSRTAAIQSGFQQLEPLLTQIADAGLPKPQLIAGGSPAFSTHHQFEDRLVSPGTVILWDWGYAQKCQEQAYLFAGLVFTRVISKPCPGIITVDMGHKAVAAENPIANRIRFLNLPDAELVSQSEEHGVIETAHWDHLHVGDGIYGIPYHICPTVNLYQEALVISNNKFDGTWPIEGRNRRLSI